MSIDYSSKIYTFKYKTIKKWKTRLKKDGKMQKEKLKNDRNTRYLS